MARVSNGSAIVFALALAWAGHAWTADAPAPPPYGGLKKTVAVDTFQAAEAVGGSVTADGMTAMLTEALVKDGRFLLVERPGLSSIQTEQALAKSGASTGTAAGGGQLIGASAIVRAAVTKYEAAAGGQSLQVGGLPFGSMLGSQLGLKNQKAVMEISLRLIDTTTGQIISIAKAEGSASSTNVDASLVNNRSGANVGLGGFHATPIGQAGEDAIRKAVFLINEGMRNVPWTATVVQAEQGTVFVNAGLDRNVEPGLKLAVFRKGKVLTDPATGEVLDVQMDRVGLIQVNTVRDKVSVASVVEGDSPQRGDILKLN